jgi:hypothetical protein
MGACRMRDIAILLVNLLITVLDLLRVLIEHWPF